VSEALIYAGIGSRDTPADVLELIESLARGFAARGWTLRTGGSPGADQAFYRGAVAAHGRVELYLPWPGFEAAIRRQAEPVRRCASPTTVTCPS
jgi:predicted Rossmann-fold nucleotide-binding protein